MKKRAQLLEDLNLVDEVVVSECGLCPYYEESIHFSMGSSVGSSGTCSYDSGTCKVLNKKVGPVYYTMSTTTFPSQSPNNKPEWCPMNNREKKILVKYKW